MSDMIVGFVGLSGTPEIGDRYKIQIQCTMCSKEVQYYYSHRKKRTETMYSVYSIYSGEIQPKHSYSSHSNFNQIVTPIRHIVQIDK